MNTYVPPIRPGETYSQGFWHAIIAATLYLIGSMMLMVNMLGYFLGHYPQHFDLDDDQRTLILQTMMFFFWLAGGAAVFSKVCGWRYADALYFCDVTVLTVGFGDYVGTNDVGRGLVFPYSVIGIIFLGLMINSIRKFAIGMSKDKVIRKHQLQKREETFSRTVTSENELRDRLGLPPRRDSMEMRRATAMSRKITDGQVNANSLLKGRDSLDQYGHFDVKGRTIKFHENKGHAGGGGRGGAGRKSSHSFKKALSRDAKVQARSLGSTAKARQSARNAKLVLLKEEKDRFEAMREIQSNTHKFEKYFALSMSVFAFGILWCVGALIFMYAERRIQDLSYFEALYFCYVSLLTIGYGDFAPKSNAGKPFFVIWSLIAVPTMTILISDMSDTVVGSINRGTFKLADWTVMPKEGVWHDFLENHPKLKDWMERKTKEREAKARVNAGFELQRPDEGTLTSPLETLENLAVETTPCRTDHELARHLSKAIKRVANDLHATVPVKYSYEEWVEFTRLIRFSAKGVEEGESSDEEDRGVLGLVRWDWIGEDSPMLAEVGEAEWVLERLCESLDRYTRVQGRKVCVFFRLLVLRGLGWDGANGWCRRRRYNAKSHVSNTRNIHFIIWILHPCIIHIRHILVIERVILTSTLMTTRMKRRMSHRC
jgi:potassium channel subfamily K